MWRFLADEHFKRAILRGLLRRLGALDISEVQSRGLRGTEDPSLLEIAAREQRIMLTHDVNTMPGFAYDRVRARLPMPGVVVVPQRISIGRAIEELVVLVGASSPDEWEGQVVFLPL